MSKAYIILGHGSRAQEANQGLKELTSLVKSKMNTELVFPAYMGFSKPSLEDVVGEIVNKGIKKIILMPFFLYRGIHLQEDIPKKIENLKQVHGNDLDIIFANHLGVDDRIADIVVDRIKEVE